MRRATGNRNRGKGLPMMKFHAACVRRCLLAAAVAQALLAIPALAADTPASRSASADQTEPDHPLARNQNKADKERSKKPVTLQTVVVTAQRRTQNLQEVPIAVSAIDAAELSARGITNIGNLSVAAPGLMSVAPGESGAGSHATTEIAIRGAFEGNPAIYWDPAVGIYLNGVYIAKVYGSLFNLPDLERTEVLRGPQGTLYGRNTLGGAISLITRPPSGEYGGTVSVGLGNYDSRVGKLVLDLPAMGKLKVSLGGSYEEREGWVKPTADSPVQKRQGDVNENSEFVALRFDATENLRFDCRYDRAKANDTLEFLQAVHSDLDTIFGIPGMVVNRTRQTHASTNEDIFERADNGMDGSAIDIASSHLKSRYRQTSHELQYLGNVGAWNWVTGLYYFEDTGFTYDPQSYFFG